MTLKKVIKVCKKELVRGGSLDISWLNVRGHFGIFEIDIQVHKGELVICLCFGKTYGHLFFEEIRWVLSISSNLITHMLLPLFNILIS